MLIRDISLTVRIFCIHVYMMESSVMSYTHGEGTQSLVYMTLGCLLDRRAAECPDKAAHVFRGTDASSAEDPSPRLSPRREVLTFGELGHRSLVLASKLLDCGLKTGDRIAIIGNNCPEWLYLEYATLRLGVVLVRIPGNLMTADTLTVLLKRFNCQGLVVDPGRKQDEGSILKKIDEIYLPGILSDTQEAIAKYRLVLKDVFFLRNSTGHTYTPKSLMALMNEGTWSETAVRGVQQTISPDDVAILLPTSGSSGFPKFSAHTHYGVINNFDVVSRAYNCQEENCIVYNDRPFSWLGAFHFIPMTSGATMVHAEGVSTRMVLEIMEVERVTGALALTYFLHDVKGLEASGVRLPPSLQYCVIGGEQIPEDIIVFARSRFKSVVLAYGSSECYLTAAINCHDLKTEEHWLNPAAAIEFKIVDEKKALVLVGEVGRILTRSRFMLLGYEEEAENTAAVFDSARWFDNGDIGKLNEEGQLLVMGRSKEVISKGMTKIYPKTVERVLGRHPKVNKVAVIGVPDPRLFNEICACVIPREGVELSETELEQFSRDSFLDSSINLVPKYFWVVKQFPLGTTGKLDRRKLIAMALDKFGLPG